MDNTTTNDTSAEVIKKQNPQKEPASKKPTKKKTSENGKQKLGMVVFLIGIASLAAGAVLLVMNLLAKPAVRDADFLVSVSKWELEDNSNCTPEPSGEEATNEESGAETNCIGGSGVIWEFTEIGKGKLTTNNHKNDYDFIWSLDENELKIETEWLYTLENDYTYKLNQNEQILTLTTGEGDNSISINFHPASSADAEVVQDN